MLLKIDIVSPKSFFYGNGNNVDLLASGFYKTNILPCKTTILGMLCYYFGIDFNEKNDNIGILKNIFINDLEYGILNKTKSFNIIKEKFSSSFHRSHGNKPTQLYSKEFILNLDITLYILIKEDSILEKSILEKKDFYGNVPGIGDKNLYPSLFNISFLKGEYKKILEFNGELLTNNFKLKDEYIGILGANNKKISLYIKRDSFIDIENKKEIISVLGGNLGIDIDVKNENILLYEGKGIILI